MPRRGERRLGHRRCGLLAGLGRNRPPPQRTGRWLSAEATRTVHTGVGLGLEVGAGSLRNIASSASAANVSISLVSVQL
jgi:hypothetical protein